MRPLNHADYLEWLGLEMDGELGPGVAGRLERHLESCGECRAIRQALGRLEQALSGERVAARAGFADEVLAVLPATGWPARGPARWLVPLALLLVLGGAALLFLMASATVAKGPPEPSIELVTGSLRDRAGLLAAGWRGAAMTLRQLIHESAAGAAGVVAAVLGLDLLLLRLCLGLRRRRPGAG